MDKKIETKTDSSNSTSFKPNTSESGHRNDHHKNNKYFIKNIFKDNPLKPSIVSASDPFITDHSAREYCSLFATDGLPNYLHCFNNFIDTVLDIPDEVFEDIAKVHIEREEKLKELEEEEEKQQSRLHAEQLNEKNTMDNKVKRMLNTRHYYVKRCCPVKIPFKSTLTHDEHEFYIRCYFKFQYRSPINSLEEKEYEQYMSMQNRVFNEQSCLMNFSHKASQMVLKVYNEVPEVIDEYISEYVVHRCERAFNYPSYYKGEIEIPLKVQIQEGSSEKQFQFKHVGHLLSLGSIPFMHIPHPRVRTTLPKDDDTLLDNKNPNCDNIFDRKSYLFKCPVSEDPNAEYLAKAYDASVVITPSAFKAIVDNQEQPYDKEWNIPIKIKSYKIKDESGNETDRRIIYIDKPLVRKSWLPLQKKYTFVKAASKAVFTGSLHRQPRCYKFGFEKRSFEKKPRKLISYDNIFDKATSDDDSVEKHSPVKEKKSCRKRLLSEELEKDLFISEDEDESRNGFDQDLNKRVKKNSGCSTAADPTYSSITVSTAAFNNTVTTSATSNNTVTTSATSINTITTSATTSTFNNTVTSATTNDLAIAATSTSSVSATSSTDDSSSVNNNSRQTSFKAAIPPPLSYEDVKKRNNDNAFNNFNVTKNQNGSQFKKGNYSANKTEGNYSANRTTGNYSAKRTRGNYSANRTEGNYSAKRTRGNYSATRTEGNYSANRNEGFLDTLLDKQDSFLKLKSPPGKSTEAIEPLLNTYGINQPSNVVDSRKPWDNTIHNKNDINIPIKNCPPESFHTNVHYQLFSFENIKQNPCREDSEKPIKILVRHSIHGLVRKKSMRKANLETYVRESRAFIVAPKIENQIYFGAEVNSISEIVQQWSDLLLRPNAHLLQVRVCTESADVVMTQEKTLETVLKEGKQKHINFNPQSVFSTFNVFLNTLMKMSSGDYLLNHCPKSGAFMRLMKSYDSNEYVFSSSVDLHKMYSEKALVSKQYRTSPWLAIDTFVFTPFHMTHHKIPATFPMENLKKLNKKEKIRRKTKASVKLSMDGYH